MGLRRNGGLYAVLGARFSVDERMVSSGWTHTTSPFFYWEIGICGVGHWW